MANREQTGGSFTADFRYTDDILADFEALYLAKKEVKLPVRIALGLLGASGALYYGWMLYTQGASIARVGYLVVCSILMLVALSGGRRQGDGTVEKYRTHYLNRRVEFQIGPDGVGMQLEKQKNRSFSKFNQIYALYDTDKCFYFVIRANAYYILSKQSVSGGTPEDFAAYMEDRCKKKFLHYSF